MKLYFYASATNQTGLAAVYDRIAKTLKATKAWVSTNLDPRHHVPQEAVAQAEASGQSLLEHMDAIIVEGTDADQQAGFLVAYAISMRRRMLFLYQRGTSPRLFEHLTTRDLPKWVEVVAYTPQKLDGILSRFLGTVQGTPVKEVPRIKFTLRVTPSIEQYLGFKVQNTKQTKADWLREQVEGLMGDDEAWQKFQKRQTE